MQLLSPAERVVEAQLHAGVDELAAIRSRKTQRAEPVEHHTDLQAACRGARERGDESVGELPGLHKVHLKKHITVRALDCPQHASEEFLADGNEMEPVPRPPRAAVSGIRVPSTALEHAATMTEAAGVRL